jgi:hypothetical protein
VHKKQGDGFQLLGDKPAEKIQLRAEKGKQVLTLRVDNALEEQGTRKVVIFSPYWILNKTNLPILCRQSVLGRGNDEPVFGALGMCASCEVERLKQCYRQCQRNEATRRT